MTDKIVWVERAGHSDAPQLGLTIGDAFLDLRPSWWLHTDREWRRRVFPRWFAMLAYDTVTLGTAYRLRDGAGGAFWLPSTAPAIHGSHDRLAEIVGESEVARFEWFDELLAAAHPEGPHEWLSVMGVAPDRQNTGLGTAMLVHHMRVLDQRHAVGYLEAANEADVKFYQNRGWTLFGPPVLLPADPTRGVPEPVPLFPMRREPGTPIPGPPPRLDAVFPEPT